MTDEVLEISLRGPRPNFLQLLAQPEMAIIAERQRHRPLPARRDEGGAARGSRLPRGEDERGPAKLRRTSCCAASGAALAVARFAARRSRSRPRRNRRRPADRRAPPTCRQRAWSSIRSPACSASPSRATTGRSPIRRCAARWRWRSTATALAAALGVPRLQPRTSLAAARRRRSCPARPSPTGPPRRCRCGARPAARTIAGARLEAPLRVRVAMPEGPGYRLVFAHLRRDWRLIGVEAERVADRSPADLRLIDAVAPANLATWYLRHFACDASPVCDAGGRPGAARGRGIAPTRPSGRRSSPSPTGSLPSLRRSSR